MPTDMLSPTAQLQTAATDLMSEIEQLKIEMREIEVLIRQTSNEIERQVQKQAEASSRLRQMEANFDQYTREDVREAYANERDAQLKLLLMRSQLEQFQSKHRQLDKYIQQLRKLQDLSARMAEVGARDGGENSPNRVITDHDAVIHTIEAQESERQRLAQQMHDGPAQSLTNLILQAEIVERLFDAEPARARSELGQLKTSANVTFQRVRDFIFALRPMMLDDLGLLPTVRRYTQQFETVNKLPVTLNLNGDRALASYIEVTIFRAVQELLNNVAKHAHASRVQVTLDLNAEPIVVIVEDDGSGFDAAQVLARARERGSSGLVTLEKRVEMLGGNINYQSATGRGTRVRVLIPSS
ncbi:MAG TPA: histidine kinase [Anaerolineae bacterium]|nr:histidine kinase [Anaerolineae bacterium]